MFVRNNWFMSNLPPNLRATGVVWYREKDYPALLGIFEDADRRKQAVSSMAPDAVSGAVDGWPMAYGVESCWRSTPIGCVWVRGI